MSRLRNVVALGVAAGLAAASLSCHRTPAPSATPAAPTAGSGAKTNLRTFQVKGVIQELQAERNKVKITHENIPGYMEAMTMLLEVKDPAELRGLARGDSISFRMLVTEDDGWIDQLKKLDGPRTPLPPEPTTFRRAREVDPLAVGDAMPEYVFTNTAGRVVRLSDYKSRAVALTFIFTRCPFPTFCPRLSGHFAQVQAQLKARSGGPTNWNLLSITIDPEYDTPARLAAYGETYQADPAHWDFVTGDLVDITAIGEQFGLQFWRANPAEPINHNVRTVVLDASGRIQWITSENEWKPEFLVDQLVRAAAVKPKE